TGDFIDLRFQAFAAGDHVVFTQTGAPGTLSLENAANTVLDSLTLNGTYATGEFVATSDGAGGTDIQLVSAANDVNADGTSDLLLQSGSTLADWLIKNAAVSGSNPISPLPAGFTLAATGDSGRSGSSDLMLQNGNTAVEWFMQKRVVNTRAVLTNGGGGGFKIAD